MTRQQKKRPKPRERLSSLSPISPSVRLSVGYCHSEEVSSVFSSTWTSLLLAEQKANRLNNVWSIRSGPKVDDARNWLFQIWLDESEDTHFFMADTDMLLPEDTIDRLLKHDKDIVAGLAFSAGLSGTRVTPNIREIVETDNGSPTIQPIWDYPRDTLLQVDGVGAACLLVKRNVAEVILQARGEDHPAPWFAYGAHNGVLIGEDIAFCLTAMKCGFKIWVDTGLIIPHVKTTAIDDEAYVLSLNMESHPHYDMREKVPVWNDYYGNLS